MDCGLGCLSPKRVIYACSQVLLIQELLAHSSRVLAPVFAFELDLCFDRLIRRVPPGLPSRFFATNLHPCAELPIWRSTLHSLFHTGGVGWATYLYGQAIKT